LSMDEQGKRIIAEHEERVRHRCREAYFRHLAPPNMQPTARVMAAMSDVNLDHCEGHIGCATCPVKPPGDGEMIVIIDQPWKCIQTTEEE